MIPQAAHAAASGARIFPAPGKGRIQGRAAIVRPDRWQKGCSAELRLKTRGTSTFGPTVSTGQGAFCRINSEVEPCRNRCTPRRPCVPATTRSIPCCEIQCDMAVSKSQRLRSGWKQSPLNSARRESWRRFCSSRSFMAASLDAPAAVPICSNHVCGIKMRLEVPRECKCVGQCSRGGLAKIGQEKDVFKRNGSAGSYKWHKYL